MAPREQAILVLATRLLRMHLPNSDLRSRGVVERRYYINAALSVLTELEPLIAAYTHRNQEEDPIT